MVGERALQGGLRDTWLTQNFGWVDLTLFDTRLRQSHYVATLTWTCRTLRFS